MDPQDAARVLKQAISLFSAKEGFKELRVPIQFGRIVQAGVRIVQAGRCIGCVWFGCRVLRHWPGWCVYPSFLCVVLSKSDVWVGLHIRRGWNFRILLLLPESIRGLFIVTSLWRERVSIRFLLFKWSVKDYIFNAGACLLLSMGARILRILLPQGQLFNAMSGRNPHLLLLMTIFYFIPLSIFRLFFFGYVICKRCDSMSKLNILKRNTAIFLKVINADPYLT